jgi:hypothetical protein
MRILLLAMGQYKFDARIRKSVLWLTSRGHDVYVLNGAEHSNFTNTPVYMAGQYDGAKIFFLGMERATHLRDGLEELDQQLKSAMGPGRVNPEHFFELVYAHELEGLWQYCAEWNDDLRRKVDPLETKRLPKAIGLPFRPTFDLPIVYDSHEYEQNRYTPHLYKELQESRAWSEQQCQGFVDSIVTVSPGLQAKLEKAFGVKAFLGPNTAYTPKRPLRPEALKERAGGPPDERCAIFCGNLTTPRRLPEFVKAARKAGLRPIMIGSKTVQEGGFYEKLIHYGARHIPRQAYPYPDVEPTLLDLVSGGVVGFNSTDDSHDNYRMSLANKVFEYALSGIPQICGDHMTDTAALLTEYGIGSTYSNGDEAGLIKQLQYWADNPPPAYAFERFREDWAYERKTGPAMDDAIVSALEHYWSKTSSAS